MRGEWTWAHREGSLINVELISRVSFCLALAVQGSYLRVCVGHFGRPVGALAGARDDGHDLAAVFRSDLHLEGWSGFRQQQTAALSLLDAKQKLNWKTLDEKKLFTSEFRVGHILRRSIQRPRVEKPGTRRNVARVEKNWQSWVESQGTNWDQTLSKGLLGKEIKSKSCHS